MSNLRAARDSLAAELAHARQGLAFYDARVAALEDTLAKLENLNSDAGLREKTRRPGREKRPGAKAAEKTKQAGNLPQTGKEFWTGLIGNQPKSTKEILESAIKALGISPSKDDLKKLSQRQANALHTLVKEKLISDTGAGRERRFYRPV
ncbi:MAG TPA: hypothetical protein VIM12_03095 [Noviherbaspirillum sp.]|jgi:hypothetical protein|uniref:hypothetical protein n=1 Tax=Noviherbaspirillum sp. TaxID=1926288 RepID=UPI002F9534A7